MQKELNIRSDEDVTQEDNIRTISKQAMLDDIYKKQVASDFAPVRKQLEEYPEEDVLIVYDYDFQYDKNFYVCLNNELREIINNVFICLQLTIIYF
jgi:hypothetical protein